MRGLMSMVKKRAGVSSTGEMDTSCMRERSIIIR
jgi:hypothetical protein